MKNYIRFVRDYMADDLCGPVRWWEIFPALWYGVRGRHIYDDKSGEET